MMLAGFITIFLFVAIFFLLTSAFMHDAQVRMIAISRAAQALLRATPPKPERHIVTPVVTDSVPITAATSTEPAASEPKPELQRGFRIIMEEEEMKLEPVSADVASLGTITIPSFALLALRLSGETITSASIPVASDHVTAYFSTKKGDATRIYAIDTKTKKARVIATIADPNGVIYATYGVSGNDLVLVNVADQNLDAAMTLDLSNPSGALVKY